MAWELRGQRRYFYRSRREGGRIRKAYGGAGLLGELAARAHAGERVRRTYRLHQEQERQRTIAADDRLLAAFDRAVEGLMRDTLVAAGLHQHHRGEWRRQRAQRAESQAHQE
jgi:hypothetical protein